jgi:hypothetical protein
MIQSQSAIGKKKKVLHKRRKFQHAFSCPRRRRNTFIQPTQLKRDRERNTYIHKQPNTKKAEITMSRGAPRGRGFGGGRGGGGGGFGGGRGGGEFPSISYVDLFLFVAEV